MLLRDKGSGVIILDKDVYVNSITEMINDKSKFRILKEDPTIYREGQLQRRLLKLKNIFLRLPSMIRFILLVLTQPAAMVT